MSIRQIQEALKGRVNRSIVGEIVKRVREQSQEASLRPVFPRLSCAPDYAAFFPAYRILSSENHLFPFVLRVIIQTWDASPFQSTLREKEKPMIEHGFARTSVITR
jgi:hypothetical protein